MEIVIVELGLAVLSLSAALILALYRRDEDRETIRNITYRLRVARSKIITALCQNQPILPSQGVTAMSLISDLNDAGTALLASATALIANDNALFAALKTALAASSISAADQATIQGIITSFKAEQASIVAAIAADAVPTPPPPAGAKK